MKTDFLVKAIPEHAFRPLWNKNERQLYKLGIQRLIVNKKPGFPCRISLGDAEIGEEVLLLNFKHHQSNSPYRSSGPIFVRKNVKQAIFSANELPKMLHHRYLSLRAYDKEGLMLNALTTKGSDLKASINNLFIDVKIAYIHVHNAGPGCFNCEIVRATTM